MTKRVRTSGSCASRKGGNENTKESGDANDRVVFANQGCKGRGKARWGCKQPSAFCQPRVQRKGQGKVGMRTTKCFALAIGARAGAREGGVHTLEGSAEQGGNEKGKARWGCKRRSVLRQTRGQRQRQGEVGCRPACHLSPSLHQIQQAFMHSPCAISLHGHCRCARFHAASPLPINLPPGVEQPRRTHHVRYTLKQLSDASSDLTRELKLGDLEGSRVGKSM